MKGALALARLICLQHTPRMLIQEYIVIYDTSSSAYTYFYESYAAVPHLSKARVIGLFSSWHKDN